MPGDHRTIQLPSGRELEAASWRPPSNPSIFRATKISFYLTSEISCMVPQPSPSITNISLHTQAECTLRFISSWCLPRVCIRHERNRARACPEDRREKVLERPRQRKRPGQDEASSVRDRYETEDNDGDGGDDGDRARDRDRDSLDRERGGDREGFSSFDRERETAQWLGLTQRSLRKSSQKGGFTQRSSRTQRRLPP